MLYKTEGVILKGRNLGEADRILTIYTREHGKLDAVAKGVRRSRGKLKGVTQPLTYTDLLLYRGKSLDTITQCAVKEMFIPLREDLERWACANFVVETLAALVPERQGQEEVFILFLTAMHLLAVLEEPESGALFFAVHLLGILGYQPTLTVCAACGAPWQEGQRLSLSGAYGGVLCAHCAASDAGAFGVAAGAVACWHRLLHLEAANLSRLKLTQYLKNELWQAVTFYLQYQLERQLKSVDFLKHLNLLNKDKKHPS